MGFNMINYICFMKRKILLLLIFTHNMTYAQDIGIKELAEWMAGTYNSSSLAKSDTSYRDINLVITPIWQAEAGQEQWMYVEQALSSMKDKPYRQRVYCVSQKGSNKYESAVYTLNTPPLYIGRPDLVNKLVKDSIRLKEGCSVYLSYMESGYFEGSTHEKDCPSELYGANYATSIVQVHREMLLSWDRGFSSDGKQVWGAEKAGYKFIKIVN
jgi:CpeT/CpcT family (DUF1001)